MGWEALIDYKEVIGIDSSDRINMDKIRLLEEFCEKVYGNSEYSSLETLYGSGIAERIAKRIYGGELNNYS